MQAELPSKSELRERLAEVRGQLSPVLHASLSVDAATQALPLLKGHSTIAVYCSIRSELDPTALVNALRLQGARILYPRVSPSSFVLDFCHVAPADLQRGCFGVPEPVGAAIVPLSEIDAFLAPALSFDPHGNRLGWGKGHYDYTLSQNAHALRVGICFQNQIVSSLPTDATDQSMDWVATDSKLYKGPARAVAAAAERGPKVQK